MAKTAKKGAAAAAPNETAAKDAAASAAVSVPASNAAPKADQAAPAADPDAAAATATDGQVSDQAPDEVTTEAPADAGAELDAANTAQVIDQAPEAAEEILAGGGVDTAATVEQGGEIADETEQEDDSGEEIAYPARARVTNNTRMPIQMTAVPLWLGPAPDYVDVVIPGKGEHDSLLFDLEAVRKLNGFGVDAFVVEVLTEESE